MEIDYVIVLDFGPLFWAMMKIGGLAVVIAAIGLYLEMNGLPWNKE